MDQTSETNTDELTAAQLAERFDSLSETDANDKIDFIELPAGGVLFKQGDPGEHLYILVSGTLDVILRRPDGSETTIDQLAPGSVVGEMALLSGGKRSATVVAVGDARLARLSRDALDAMPPEEQDALAVAAVPRWQRVQLAKSLSGLFGDLDADSLQTLQSQMTWRRLAAGEVLFRQGEPSDGMYLVVGGRLHVFVSGAAGDAALVGEIGPGESVGEFALLTDEARSATVYAARDTTVAWFRRVVFDRLVREHPDLMRKIAGIIVQRLHRELGHKTAQTPERLILALLPSSPAINTWQFAQDLAGALARFGTAAALNAARFDDQLHDPGAANIAPGDPTFPAVVAWMDEFEADRQYVLYAADYSPSLWTRRCIGRADRVLLLTDPRADPGVSPAERLLDEREMPVRTERVFWHQPATEQPAGTGRWLDVRSVDVHYHVRQGSTDHMDRLARRLTGNAVALVFSGGSALGLAYLGIYKALLEVGIPIDYVGGTSMGSLAGASVARELPYQEVADMAEYGGKLGVFDVTLPLAALTASDHLTRICQRACGDVQIEDLWIPYFCVSTSLSRAEPVIHERGSLWRAVRASTSIPGVFLPIVENDNVLVDGALMNNFPVDIMVARCGSKHIIGGLVMPYREMIRRYDYEASLSGWRILLNRINPFSKRLRTPSLMKTLLRSFDINGLRLTKSQQEAVDLLILPDVTKFVSSDFDKWQPLSKAGYAAAIEPLRKWWEERGI